MEYKGFVARIKFDVKADMYYGEVLDSRDAITSFQGKTIDEANARFVEAVEHYIRVGAGDWEEDEPISGRVEIRLWPELHQRIIHAAKLSGKDVEDWIADILDRAAEA